MFYTQSPAHMFARPHLRYACDGTQVFAHLKQPGRGWRFLPSLPGCPIFIHNQRLGFEQTQQMCWLLSLGHPDLNIACLSFKHSFKYDHKMAVLFLNNMHTVGYIWGFSNIFIINIWASTLNSLNSGAPSTEGSLLSPFYSIPECSNYFTT